MASRIVRAGEPQDLLDYLNSFPNDPLRYVIDPNDARQVIVENQKIFTSENYILPVGSEFTLSASNGKLFFCKVVAKSLWNPSLILVEGLQLHTFSDSLIWNSDGLIWNSDGKPSNNYSKKLKQENEEFLESVGSNIITIISDEVDPHDQGPPPTRNSPDDGMPTPPPTRNSDGTRVPDPTRNSPAGLRNSYFAEPTIPLTEYWLNRAKKHNKVARSSPVVAIMDTGIDFRYDWTMGHETIKKDKQRFTDESIPDCPLWYNENQNTGNLRPEEGADPEPILQKDYIGWNFVGVGQLASNQHPNPYDDDSTQKHGTRIAAIIAQQTDWQVRLMILKTHDYRGIGPLFNIFCAFDYLNQRAEGVKIINASWGYYGGPNQTFLNYINQLEQKGIWFVNAAGNQTDFKDDYHGHELKANTRTERYPACFTNRCVVTVTTAKNRLRLMMSPPTQNINFNVQTVENYSAEFVDVAVGAGHNGTFPESLAETETTIKGSSYAAAYYTGRLARYPAISMSDVDVTNRFCKQISNSTSTVLSNRIRAGNFLLIDMDFFEESY